MSKTCPISTDVIDNTVARMVAGIVAYWLVISLVFNWAGFLFFVMGEYAYRLLYPTSPTVWQRLSTWIATYYELPVRTKNAAPSKFATLFGLVVSTTAFIAWGFAPVAGFTITAILLCAVLLYAVRDICLACYIYGVLPSWVTQKIY